MQAKVIGGERVRGALPFNFEGRTHFYFMLMNRPKDPDSQGQEPGESERRSVGEPKCLIRISPRLGSI